MLSKKENLRQTIRGGNPDRFVNQYEYLALQFDPISMGAMGNVVKGGPNIKSGWGVTISYPDYVPGPFPVCTGDAVVIKDVSKWRDYVQAPPTQYPEEAWAPFIAAAEAVDRNDQFVAPFIGNGLFEKLHYQMGMEETMINFYEEPEAMHELIDFFTEWEIEGAKEVIKYLKPDALFHHDDWGSHNSSFLAPEMFKEFFLEPYKRIYRFWKDNGVELVVHHSDSYAANLVPYMIEMGVDVWQGAVSTNDIPGLVKQYGSQISIHGGMDNGVVDVADWTQELIAKTVEDICRACGKHYFIPGATMGGPESTYPGVYEAVTAEIDRMSKIMF